MEQAAGVTVTAFQWVTLGLGVAGFVLTWTGMLISIAKAVGQIKTSTDDKIASETKTITDRITKLSEQFEEDQRKQDNSFGEIALGIRQYVNSVEKQIHMVEIWSRDNFVLKSDFMLAIERLSAEMKDNFKTLMAKLDDINKSKG